MSSPEHPTSAALSVKDSKRLYRRRFEEVVSGGDLALADELLGPGYGLHFPGMPETLDRAAHQGAGDDVPSRVPRLGRDGR